VRRTSLFWLSLSCAAIVCVTAGAQAPPPTLGDLDAFMGRVLARRDENWKKLQQYVLEERERFELVGPDRRRLYGFQRDYTWFIRQGYFVRSPLRADGVQIGESERRRYEAKWVTDEKKREARRAARRAEASGQAQPAVAATSAVPDAPVEDVVRQGIEPQFVQAAYFLRFKFEPGRYGLVGREPVDGIDALRIEYYPQQLFREGRTRPNKQLRERDDRVEEKVNKASLVTLWVAPATHQILKYTFDNVDWDFLPGRALVRIDSLVASMRMAEAFPSVWLPRDIQGRFRLTLAVGTMEAMYDVQYHDYKQADVTYKVK
jgi:hypothetical protein